MSSAQFDFAELVAEADDVYDASSGTYAIPIEAWKVLVCVVDAAREVDYLFSGLGPGRFRYDGHRLSAAGESALLSLHDYLNEIRAGRHAASERTEPGSSAADVDGAESPTGPRGHHESVGERQGRQPGSDTCGCGHEHTGGRVGSCSKFTCPCGIWHPPIPAVGLHETRKAGFS